MASNIQRNVDNALDSVGSAIRNTKLYDLGKDITKALKEQGKREDEGIKEAEQRYNQGLAVANQNTIKSIKEMAGLAPTDAQSGERISPWEVQKLQEPMSMSERNKKNSYKSQLLKDYNISADDARIHTAYVIFDRKQQKQNFEATRQIAKQINRDNIGGVNA